MTNYRAVGADDDRSHAVDIVHAVHAVDIIHVVHAVDIVHAVHSVHSVHSVNSGNSGNSVHSGNIVNSGNSVNNGKKNPNQNPKRRFWGPQGTVLRIWTCVLDVRTWVYPNKVVLALGNPRNGQQKGVLVSRGPGPMALSYGPM